MGVLYDSKWSVKSQHIIIILDALAILGICQNIICHFMVWTISPKLSPSKTLYHMVDGSAVCVTNDFISCAALSIKPHQNVWLLLSKS